MDLQTVLVTVDEHEFELDPSTLGDASGAEGDGDVVLMPIAGTSPGRVGRGYEALVDGWRFEVTVESAARALLRERASTSGGGARSGGTATVRAQIPGRIVAVFVSEGEEVETGARLLSLEAMKMENEVRAPRAGRIGRVGVAAGERVELGDELVVIE